MPGSVRGGTQSLWHDIGSIVLMRQGKGKCAMGLQRQLCGRDEIKKEPGGGSRRFPRR